MINNFTVTADIRAGQINPEWTWQSADPVRPGIRLVRQMRAYSRKVDSGLTVVDLADIFREPEAPWHRIERTIFLIPRIYTQGDSEQAAVDVQAEDDIFQAAMGFYFAAASDAYPLRVGVSMYDDASGSIQETSIDGVTRVESNVAATPPWDAVHTVDIYHAPGGGPEETAGQLVISTGHSDTVTPDRLTWTPTGDPASFVDFDKQQELTTTVDGVSTSDEHFKCRFTTLQVHPEGDTPLASIVLDEAFNPDSGEWQRHTRIADQGLSGETQYYYSLFVPTVDGFVSHRMWRASAMATSDYGLAEKLYDLLPAVHKQYDEPTVDRQGYGQLRRFLEIAGSGLNQARSLAEAVRQRHDVTDVPADFLPAMARWIGWEPDQTLDELAQRRDIRMAPEIFQTVGTLPNICALVNRLTGWPCRVKEFVHNIFLTNTPEIIRLWELYQLRFNGEDWFTEEPVTRTDGFDGAPSAVRTDTGEIWLFWHADRSARREIWLQRLGTDANPRRVMSGTPDDSPDATYIDEYPCTVMHGDQVRLFWTSNRQGTWDIWSRSFDALPGSGVERITEHVADDRNPAAVATGDGRLWLFWQSTRRGDTDIWSRVLNGSGWSAPQRITTAVSKHEMPAAVVDGLDRVWLFWVSDEGNCRNINYSIYDGIQWSEAQPVTMGSYRNEAPSAAFYDGRVWLFYDSNRSGFWQVWGQCFEGPDWDEPQAITNETTADKEPGVCVDADGNLRIFWRSQRRGRNYQSRTIDTDDLEMLADLKTFQDRAHYTYDLPPPDHPEDHKDRYWYGRGVVGLYLIPDTVDPDVISRRIARVRDFVEPFRPLPVRFVWMIDGIESDETIDTTGLITEEYTDEIL